MKIPNNLNIMIDYLEGYLLIDKPANITSFDCIRYIKKFLSKKLKISHMGTLDPFATGLLILGLGKATKKSGTFLALDKEYIARAKIGELTETLDLTGLVTKTDRMLNKTEIELAIQSFGNKYLQIPPVYSALKYNGARLYDLARNKKLSEESLKQIASAKAREINIYDLSLTDYKEPYFSIKAHTSHGTYIRSLVNDIAIKAGSCATTYQLRRTKIGHFSIINAVELYAIKKEEDIISNLISLSADNSNITI